MKPTVGRIIHYGFRASDSAPVETLAGIVTAVLPDHGLQDVNIWVWPSRVGAPFPLLLEDIRFGTAEDGISPKSGCWCWPPKVN